MLLCGINVRGDWVFSGLEFGPVVQPSLALMTPLVGRALGAFQALEVPVVTIRPIAVQ